MKSTTFLTWLRIFSTILFVDVIRAQERTTLPSVVGVKNVERHFTEGENALLTCVVSNIGTNTVIWSKVVDGTKVILTIDNIKVVRDDRITVLHDKGPRYDTPFISSGGSVWVLSLENITKSDAGGYICRVNSSPPVQTYIILNVESDTGEQILSAEQPVHNYTDCCQKAGVDQSCLGFCTINDILQGSTGVDPETCEKEFPKIVRCMADMRDHVPCCEEQGIPDVCQDLCRGEYTVEGDYVQSHFSCTAYTEATLLCIAQGIEILPKAPVSPSALADGSTSINVEWGIPLNSAPIEHFIINVTTIAKFDPPVDVTKIRKDGSDDVAFPVPPRMQILTPGNATRFKLEKLIPFTWYEVSVMSSNKHGKSLPPYNIRVMTKPSNPVKRPVRPKLPDVMGCCKSKGIEHERCLQNLCNPYKRYIEQPDMIVCAAWASESFSCLADGQDHSDCCREKGLPDKCVEICSGNVTKIDYTYFKCVDYFSDYRSCLLKGYGVLPGPPKKVSVTNINPTFALLSWIPPEQNTKSISSYHSYFRPIEPSTECSQKNNEVAGTYQGVHAEISPTIMENLCPDTKYEVYIQAFNNHGISDPSSRVIFRTTKELPTRNATTYNVTQCCQEVRVSPGCFPLCSYNPKMSQTRTLANTCKAEMSSILKCVVGGRDHRPCCTRRGVPKKCESLCAGALNEEDYGPNCLSYIGNIMLCMEEGIDLLPGPIRGLHATQVSDGGLTIVWEPPVEGSNYSYYEVHYQRGEQYASSLTMYKLNNTINATKTYAEITGMKKGDLVNVFVVAVNDWGSSLPSSLLTVNLTVEENAGVKSAVPSAPHSVMVEDKTATTLTIMWQPPAYSLPTDRFMYDIHYAALVPKNQTPVYNVVHSGATAKKLKNLKPNTQYVIFVSALNDMGESRLSETLLAWTDPAYPAFVETPTVHPTNLVVEGDSMTVLCIAMGSPPPTVSLYISGKLVHENVTRHMVTVVKNVTRDMTDIACYADNGYGTPMQSVIKIQISHRPMIEAQEVVRAVEGEEAELECTVQAWPEPSLVWWVNPESRVPVIHGGNTSLVTINVKPGVYRMRLTVKYAEDKDYFCRATNALGTFTHTVKLRTHKEVRMQLKVAECCTTSNISDACIDACDFDQVNFHQIMNRDECIPDFGKFMTCGADGSDHRGCCSVAGVPALCLDWCRGKTVTEERFMKICLLQWAPVIFDCFHEGKDSLPGPPRNLKLVILTPNSARISWDIPSKNPEKVELYRVFWRANGTRYPFKSDTAATSIIINNLTEGAIYEAAVKAGNIHGTSILSETKTFKQIVPYISSQSTTASNQVGVALGIIFCIVFVMVVVGLAYWLIRRRQLLAKGNGISFSNPSYIREQSGDAVQIAETPNGSLNGTITSNGSSQSNGSLQNGDMTNGAVWNTQVTPGFEPEISGKGGYTRFKS